jgi:8-oxo-dGTP diphosphatase
MSQGVVPAVKAAVVYKNPTPVVVGLVPVLAFNPATGSKAIGVLTLERGIEPQKGKLALPGGYLEYEDWREGLLRELHEETTLNVCSADEVTIQSVHSVDQGKKLLLFATTPMVDESTLRDFAPNTEVTRLVVIFSPQLLAFPTHTEAVKIFFRKLTQPAPQELNRLTLPGGNLCSAE